MPFALSTLPAVEPVVVEKTFTDPRCPGANFPCRFAFLPFECSVSDQFEFDRGMELYREYVKPNIPFIVSGGARVPINSTFCMTVASLMLAEQAASNENITPATEWFTLSVLAPNAWKSIIKWHDAENRKAKGLPAIPDPDAEGEPEAKNDSAGGEAN